MKAAQIHEYGHADVIKINEIDKPVAGENQVLVAVEAASLNPFDTTVREGHVKEMIPALPVTLGGDIAGVVSEVGAGVKDILVGDRVYGTAAAVAGNSGAFAEFARTKTTQLAKAPEGLSFMEAASLPLVGVSAVQALTEHIDLQSGQKIFIHGASGGIGTIAVQIAKHLGAYVAASVRGKDTADLVQGLGADEVIDTQSQDFATVLRDYDAVFEAAGGEDFDKTLDILKRGGIAVSMLAAADQNKADQLGVKAVTQSTQVTKERLERLCELVEAGVVKAQVAQTFSLDDIQAAFEARESGKTHGKVVIQIQ